MTGAQTAAVASELAAARNALVDLRRELAAVAESTALVPDDEHDAEGSTVGFERARVIALIGWAEERVVHLQAAAARLAAGTYRQCGDCGGDIGAERLEALPATQVCVPCARLRTSNSGKLGPVAH
jgi:DnaK suppressor protein